MGGSALAAAISVSWPGHNRPFEIVRGYNIPEYVSDRTFFIASSYSGNTEETLAALEEAENKKAQIAIIASGGKLVEIASEKGYPLIQLPGNLQPQICSFLCIQGLDSLVGQRQFN
jgi:glucose/mannose-6-phosphate isomerase